MPADVRLHVVPERLLAERESLVTMALRVEDQRLHSLRVAMVGVLLEDLIGGFDAWRGQSCQLTLVWYGAPFLYCLPS